jgi:hypothetical protein
MILSEKRLRDLRWPEDLVFKLNECRHGLGLQL